MTSRIHGRRKVPMKNLGPGSRPALGRPGRPTGSSGHFFCATLAAKSRFNSFLANLHPAGELREKPQRRAWATRPSHGLRDPLVIPSGRGPNSVIPLNAKTHQFYFAKRQVSKIGCRPRVSVAKTFSQTYRFVYVKPLLLSREPSSKNPGPALKATGRI